VPSKSNILSRRLLVVSALLFTQRVLGADSSECRDDLRDSDHYVVRSVTVAGRWVPSIQLPLKAGDSFSNAKVQGCMEAVRQALISPGNQSFELNNLGSAGVLHIGRCLKVEGKQVDVVIQPRYLRVDLYQVGQNILPIPRSSLPSFYQAVPPALLAFNPALGFYQDEHYGLATTWGFSASLLDLAKTLHHEETTDSDLRLELAASGRKSFANSFYTTDVDLTLAKQNPGAFIENLDLVTNYQGKEQPQGDNNLSRQAFELGGNARLRPDLEFVRTTLLGVKYQWSDNSFTENGTRKWTNENSFQAHLIAEGRAARGFLRGGLWINTACPESGDCYERIAGLLGYEKEFVITPGQTLGIETVIGGGQTWDAPSYAQFYGGNSDRNFLYDSLNSPNMSAFPAGPWIRSFGEGQATPQGSRGATRYWQFNVNIAPPIPFLSHPLIPDEEVAPGVTLKQLLKNKAGDSVNFYAAQLVTEGLSPEEALAKAKATYGEVKPAVEFIADQANIYSIKPLVLCDVAGMDAPNVPHRVRVAVGGGLQITVVIAKFEIGYMHTAIGRENDPSGNLFARLVFQNIF
jgi:hypothetical protein